MNITTLLLSRSPELQCRLKLQSQRFSPNGTLIFSLQVQFATILINRTTFGEAIPLGEQQT